MIGTRHAFSGMFFFFSPENKMTGHIKRTNNTATRLLPATRIPTNCYAQTVRRLADAPNEEVTDMYFTRTNLTYSTAAAAFIAMFSLNAPVFAIDADKATLKDNEHAAQNAIAYAPIYGSDERTNLAEATLAHNEAAARDAIASGPVQIESSNSRLDRVASAASGATLTPNELSAQHAIVDAQAGSAFSSARRESTALNTSASTQAGGQR